MIQTEAAVAEKAASEIIDVSVLVPVYNEEGNVPVLCERLLAVLDKQSWKFEIILVDDGSKDNTAQELRAAAAARPEIKVIRLRRNYGQTAAMMAGIDHARGETIIPIDADLQNDPEDIPALVAKLDEGYDVVSGWRKDRKDVRLKRTLVSRVANSLISRVSRVRLRDYGCTLKAYRRDVIKGVRLYGEMHRFIPIYATWQGARVTELPVRHHPRVHGQSKYGLERTLKVVLDLMVVMFLDRHFTKPIYVFGGFGAFSLMLSLISFVTMLYLKFFKAVSMIITPLPLLTAMLFLTGVTSILMGLLAEMIVRTYFESQDKSVYLIRETLNC